MNKEQKKLAYQAIDEVVIDSTARQIIKYVMKCELLGQYIINPTNNYLANKYGWTSETVRKAIYLAKKSQFITIVNQKRGGSRGRLFELNVNFLKVEMAKIFMRRPTLKTIDFSEFEQPSPRGEPIQVNVVDTVG